MGVEVGDIYKYYDEGVYTNNCWVTKIIQTTGAFDVIEFSYLSYSRDDKRIDTHTLKINKRELNEYVNYGVLIKHEEKIKPIKEFNRFSFVNGI